VVASKSALIIHACSFAFYRQGHVPGALNLSRDHFGLDYVRLQPILKEAKDHPIVVYCSGGACHDSKMVPPALTSLGLKARSESSPTDEMGGRRHGCRRICGCFGARASSRGRTWLDLGRDFALLAARY
jgi:hypothetical protein